MSNRVLSVHQEHELLLRLELAGLGEKEAQALIESKGNALARILVALIKEAEPKINPSHAKAALIMGENFIRLDQVEKLLLECYRTTLLPEQRAALVDIPFSEETLRKCRGTHVLIPAIPFTFKELIAPKDDKEEQSLFQNEPSFLSEERMETRWLLVRKIPTKELEANEEVISVAEAFFVASFIYSIKGWRVFNDPTSTKNINSDGSPVYIRISHYTGRTWLYFSFRKGGQSVTSVSSRKPESVNLS